MVNFDVQTEAEGTSALVKVQGDLDVQVVDQLVETFTQVESDKPELLVIDLSRLSFMDSTGMGAVAAASIRARDSGRRFAIVAPRAGVRQAFDRTKLDDVITTTENLSDVYP